VAFAEAQVKHFFGDYAELSLTTDYLYLDQIQDVSITETNLQAARVHGHTLTGRPAVRFNFPGHYWISLEADPTREWLGEPLGDYTELAGRFSVGWDYGYQSEVSLRYEPGYRDYDTEPALTAEGEPIPGETRSFTMQEVRLNWRHHWDPARHWRTTTRLGYKMNRDKNAGFFDYTKVYAGEQIRYRASKLECWVEGKVAHYDYDVQTVSSSSSEKRDRTELFITLQAEWQFTKWLRMVLTYDYEQALSNISIERYTANTVSGSLQWSF